MRLIHKKVLQIAIVVYEKLNCKFYCPTFIILQILAFEFVFLQILPFKFLFFVHFIIMLVIKQHFILSLTFFLKQQ